MARTPVSGVSVSKFVSLRKKIWRYRYLYLMLLPPIAYFLIFRYGSLVGLQVAFKNYNLFKGMWDSPWVGLDVFREIFSYQKFWQAFRNTALLNGLDLICGFPVPIMLAILLYEIRSVPFKRFCQTCMYLPHFLSWIIIGGMANMLLASDGLINRAIIAVTGSPVNFLMAPLNWVLSYVGVGIWQSAGWGTIVYLAAISGVDASLYEAAEVDGCGTWRRIWYITIPCIMPTIIVMLILKLGSMASIGFERPYVMGNKMVTEVSEVLSTFVYKMGLQNARYSFATASGLFISLLNMIFLTTANKITKSMGESALW